MLPKRRKNTDLNIMMIATSGGKLKKKLKKKKRGSHCFLSKESTRIRNKAKRRKVSALHVQ
jgi:hypothetical protein